MLAWRPVCAIVYCIVNSKQFLVLSVWNENFLHCQETKESIHLFSLPVFILLLRNAFYHTLCLYFYQPSHDAIPVIFPLSVAAAVLFIFFH